MDDLLRRCKAEIVGATAGVLGGAVAGAKIGAGTGEDAVEFVGVEPVQCGHVFGRAQRRA